MTKKLFISVTYVFIPETERLYLAKKNFIQFNDNRLVNRRISYSDTRTKKHISQKEILKRKLFWITVDEYKKDIIWY